jgi:TatD DNase family protein
LQFIDTHCHLNFEAFDEDRDAVVERAVAAGVARILIPAIDRESAESAIHLAEMYDVVRVAIGLHPNEAAADPAEMEAILALASHPSVVAIGEIGLDYHWNKAPVEAQAAALAHQLAYAHQRGLPVIIHNRDSTADLLETLAEWVHRSPLPAGQERGVLHSFSGTLVDAKAAVALGFLIGITGPVTFRRNADEIRRIAQEIPLDRILIETDSPFLAPVPHRGRRNEPAYVTLVAQEIATLRGEPLEEIARVTTANAVRLFGAGFNPTPLSLAA